MREKYVVVQRTGFMPYFLSEWYEGVDLCDRWDRLRSRALQFDLTAARRVMKQLNAARPTAILPVEIELVR